jgi:hypothetical protein
MRQLEQPMRKEWIATAFVILWIVGSVVFFGFSAVGKVMVEQARFEQIRPPSPPQASAHCIACEAAR